jgi:1-acyl-sn-glycerol-3-phosphate acyltransferase
VLLITGVLVPIVAPVALIIAVFADLVTRTRRWRRSRGVLLIASLILIDLLGRIFVFGAWLISPFGIRPERATSQSRYRWIMTSWARSLMWAICRITPLPLDTSELDDDLLFGNAIVIGRHRSLLDAVYPAALFGKLGLTTHYTLKEDLQWEPNIDIVGQRMGHVFLNRAAKDLESELGPIRELGKRIDENSVGVIFPEGTFFNEVRKARALASIERKDPDRADVAAKMQYVLPPHPAGMLAFMEGAPDADIIVLGHVGFEPFGTMRDILANLGAEHNIVVRAWRFARSSVPDDPKAQIEWLFDRWLEMDEWVASHHPLRPAISPQHSKTSLSVAD